MVEHPTPNNTTTNSFEGHVIHGAYEDNGLGYAGETKTPKIVMAEYLTFIDTVAARGGNIETNEIIPTAMEPTPPNFESRIC
jgi:hypothetical protein